MVPLQLWVVRSNDVVFRAFVIICIMKGDERTMILDSVVNVEFS